MAPGEHLDLPDDISQMDLVSWTFANLDNEDYDPEKKIYVNPDDPSLSISASEARITVRKLIAGFKAVGLQSGDCVCVHAFNNLMYSMLFLSIVGAGGCFTGSNPAYTTTELSHHIQNTKARFVITESEFLPTVINLATQESGVHASNVFVLDTPSQGTLRCKPLQHLLVHGEEDWVTFSREDEAKDTTAALLSTSGTTGLPKAAMISHYSCVVANTILADSKHKPYNVSRLISLPEFHAFAFPLAHLSPLREGIPTYIMRRFDMKKYLHFIEQYQITETPMVPAIMTAILKLPPLEHEKLQSLRLVLSAGAPLDQRTQDQMYRLLVPSARVVQVWGMTEAGWITTFLWPEKDHTGSVGRLLPGVEAKLVGDDGNTVAKDNEKAEISIRSPLVMQGYLGNDEATYNALDADGWLKTGDIGYQEQGKFYIVDRKKEMIKVRGWQVSPAELEAVLMIHTEVLEAAVIGASNPNASGDTEVPRAYIVKVPGSDLSESNVKTHMVQYLAKYKNLDGGIVFIDRIPRTSTGKIDRKSLRERAKLESKDAHIKTLVVTAFSSLRRARHSSYDESKTATASIYGSDGALPVSPITTTSDYSDPSGEKQEAARTRKYYHYAKKLRLLWRAPRPVSPLTSRQKTGFWTLWGKDSEMTRSPGRE